MGKTSPLKYSPHYILRESDNASELSTLALLLFNLLSLYKLDQRKCVAFRILAYRKPAHVREWYFGHNDLAALLLHAPEALFQIAYLNTHSDGLSWKPPAGQPAVNASLVAVLGTNMPILFRTLWRDVLPAHLKVPAEHSLIEADSALGFIGGDSEVIDSRHPPIMAEFRPGRS